jgi:NAD(P)-dependent dehydrogenase (short-subunit alcohol dehydrogenase family)
VVTGAIAAFGRIDVLVNNAGISDKHSPAIRASDDLWDAVIATNLTGTFYFCRATLPHMVEQGSGSIVNMGSIGGVYHCAGVSYSAAKAGVNGLTRNIALQYAGSGIRCNSVNPGPTATTMISPESFSQSDPEMMELTAKHMFLEAGACEPIDQANAVLFLASDESRYITGQWLVVDRGVCL